MEIGQILPASHIVTARDLRHSRDEGDVSFKTRHLPVIKTAGMLNFSMSRASTETNHTQPRCMASYLVLKKPAF